MTMGRSGRRRRVRMMNDGVGFSRHMKKNTERSGGGRGGKE